MCYTWWCLSALSILGRLHWLDSKALQDFILSCQVRCVDPSRRCSEYSGKIMQPAGGCAATGCNHMPCSQDPEEGGISDRPEDEVDVFHTFFGLAGLSLMGFPGLGPIDPVYALPTEVVQRVKLKHQAAS